MSKKKLPRKVLEFKLSFIGDDMVQKKFSNAVHH